MIDFKISKNNCKKIVDYISAIENEMAIDEYLYKKFRVKSSDYNFFPKPSKWLRSNSIVSFIIKKASGMLRIHWKMYLASIYYLLCFVISLFKYFTTKKQKLVQNEFYLLFSGELSFKLIEENIETKNGTYIYFNKKQIIKMPSMRQVDIMALSSFKDLYEALLLSFVAFKRIKSKKTIFYSYTSYTWFLYYLTLQKLSGSFVTTEHYDRWAFLLSSLINSKIERKNYSTLTVIQHGILSRDIVIKNKLTYINKFIAFDLSNAQMFISTYVRNVTKLEISIELQKNDFFLTELKHIKQSTILIIGHPICLDFHKFLLQQILLEFECIIYYKPHPSHITNIYVEDERLIILKEKNIFPRVKAVLSYPSTLERSYNINGTYTYLHDIDITAEFYMSELVKIRSELKKIL